MYLETPTPHHCLEGEMYFSFNQKKHLFENIILSFGSNLKYMHVGQSLLMYFNTFDIIDQFKLLMFVMVTSTTEDKTRGISFQ